MHFHIRGGMKMHKQKRTNKSSLQGSVRVLAGLIFVFVTAASPWWLTKGVFLPITQKAAVFSAQILAPFEAQSTNEQAEAAFREETVVEPTAATTASTTTTAAPTTTTAATTTTTTAAPKEEQDDKNLRPVKESRVKGGEAAAGINVKNGTGYKLDIAGAMKSKADCKILLNAGYQVLVIHTHTTETYAQEASDTYSTEYSPRTTDKARNMVAVGDVVAERLEEAGIKTLHVTTIHDYPQYNGSYNRAEETIRTYLEKYPSIEMVIDIHRDSITYDDGTKLKPTVEINGKKAAQIMIITGCDNNGKLDFPDWKKNLRMAAQLQKQLTDDWEGLMRPLYFAPFRYNMHMTHNSLLVEFGTDVNTLEEAKYSADLFGRSLREVLLGYVVEPNK